jgi:hypothetical protein
MHNDIGDLVWKPSTWLSTNFQLPALSPNHELSLFQLLHPPPHLPAFPLGHFLGSRPMNMSVAPGDVKPCHIKPLPCRSCCHSNTHTSRHPGISPAQRYQRSFSLIYPGFLGEVRSPRGLITEGLGDIPPIQGRTALGSWGAWLW